MYEKIYVRRFFTYYRNSKKLYHEHVSKMPIIDYHCHINPKEIYEDHKYDNISEIWLGGDHYKWRAMRSNGIEERFITGTDTTPYEKFENGSNSSQTDWKPTAPLDSS